MAEDDANPKKSDKYPGKVKGTLNKRTKLKIGTIDRMFLYLGGEKTYKYWCEQHKDFFYEEYTKMIIKERINKGGMNLDANVTFKWIEDSGPDNGPL